MDQKRRQAFNKFITGALILFSFQLHAMEVVELEKKEMQFIDEIPEYCIGLLEKLLEEPVQGGAYSEKCKMLSCDNDYAQICAILSNSQRGATEGFNLFNFQDHGFLHCRPQNILNGQRCAGIEIVWPSLGQEECPLNQDGLDELKALYERRIRGVQRGWNEKKGTNDYYLFSKKRLFGDEDTLIRFLINKFNISLDDFNALRVPVGSEYIDLQIKKDVLEKVKSVFKFTTNKECADRLANDLALLLPHSEKNLPELPPEMIEKIARQCWDCDES